MSLPTPFLTKTYKLVDDPSMDEVISWNDDGTSFIVWNQIEFARDVLPKYFKHNNFSSFVRQLNTYGFRKIGPDRWEFTNDFFRKGEKCLLRNIQRRKLSSSTTSPAVTAAVPLSVAISPSNSGDISSSSTPTATAAPPSNLTSETSSGERDALVNENARLRKENSELTRELSDMRSMCKNIYSFMSSYNTNNGIPVEKSLNLSRKRWFNGEEICRDKENQTEIEMNPKLFGFSIGLKRAREESEAAMPVHDNFLQLQQKQPGMGGVDSVPLDCDQTMVRLQLG